jgi:tetratricopeptide (TPR) repeat protein
VTEGLTARIEESWAVPAVLKPLAAIPKPWERSRPVFLTVKDAKHLLDTDRAAAKLHARKTLAADPHNSVCLYMLGGVYRRNGQFANARAILEQLTITQPQMGYAWFELGMALNGLGEREKACAALLSAVDLNWTDQDCWYALGDLLPFPQAAPETGREIDPRLAEAEAAVDESRLDDAKALLDGVLKKNGRDVRARKLLADVMFRTGRWAEFETLMRECLETDPDFLAARFRYVTMCFVRGKIGQILPHVEELLAAEPANALYRSLKALVLYHGQQIQPAIDEFGSVLANGTGRPGLWCAYARALQTARDDNAAVAYLAAIDIVPSLSDAWLGLGYVTSFRGDETLMARLEAVLARPGLPEEDRARLHFVLGRCLENLEQYARSFEHFRTSNRILRSTGSAAASRKVFVQRAKSVFTSQFFRARQGWGCEESGPIFIVGMPRSGSTLVEQILSSHPSIEALGELTVLTRIARRFIPDRPGDPEGGYPNDLRSFDRDRVCLLGEEYLKATRVLRRRATPFFVDKLPSNYLHVGLIRLALPHARIVDVRRHPLDCCFSCFKHYFAAGLIETTDLGEIGRAYAEYVELMAHFDAVLPGQIHRILYENLIGGLETEVRRVLDFLGLPFERQCLKFYENDRFVRTISAEQVNKSLYDTAVGHWRHYEQWLGPLKDELGYVSDAYPEAPKFYSSARVRSRNPISLGQSGYHFDCVRGLGQSPFTVQPGAAAKG